MFTMSKLTFKIKLYFIMFFKKLVLKIYDSKNSITVFITITMKK